jgi:hypothetical protein
MTTITFSQTRNSNNPFPKIIIFCCILTLVILGAGVSAHALEKHGEDAITAEQCYEKHGAVAVYLNPSNQRKVYCVPVPELSRFGIIVTSEEGKIITQFIKNKMKTVEDVLRYIVQSGATVKLR